MDKESEFENSVHLDPDLTWEDASEMIYEGIRDGKLTKEDIKEFFKIGSKECYEPRHLRIFVKALSSFFLHQYEGTLKNGEEPGVIVKVDGKQWLVQHRIKRGEITIDGPVKYDCPDRSFVISHESEADAKIDAWEKGERYAEEIK
jgi:hypothetical protein